jgi:membrane-associated phospholipid phosphatase
MKKIRGRVAGLLVFCLLPVALFSSDEHETRFKVYWKDFWRDAGQIWTYPFHIKSRDVLPLLALAGTVAAILPQDEAMSRDIRDLRARHAWVGDASGVVSQMGFLGAGGVMAVFLGVGLIGNDDKATETALLGASAALQTFLVTDIVQGLTGRQCPKWDDGADHWAGPAAFFDRHKNGQGRHFGAFPSGHTAAAFSLATIIDMQYGKSVWVPILAYTVAAGVGVSMAARGEHWVSDVVVGAVVGSLISRTVVNNHRRSRGPRPSVGLGPHGVAVALAF